jgi:hypothetical protein
MKKIFTFFLLSFFVVFLSDSISQVRCNHDNFRFFDKPFIELNNGTSKLSLDGFGSKFSNAGLIELKLGSVTQYKSRYSKSVLKYFNSYVFINKVSSSLDYSTKTAGTLPFDMWRFGAGKKEGYGVKIGSMSITPYTSSSLVWSYLDMRNFPDATLIDDNYALAKFNKSTRFGTQGEGGLIFNILPMVSFEAKYERSAIFPRTLFWKYLGSAIIEEGGMQMVDHFVTRVLKNEPLAGVIVNFVLKNAYSYGIYELRKSKMNWPFATDAPLMHETFKFGVSFTF